ncbi:hypothetical protein [uncultured Microbacterium sp.]|uniref:hypothetical protein n=1 Tax=uncultured Microbacterium sp. TaxID=191216 RepID=UPI0025EFA8FE|nr:hypothetical protein [uncultured Microbacterium sp.]
MVWKNGQIPEADLVVFRRGRDRDGDWFWALTPATLARHNALVARALARTGRTLTPGEGFSTYRPIPAQRIAKARYGIGAADVGTSSHGGYWEKRETLAIDYDNWAWVYEGHGGRAAFYDDCRAVGLEPGMIEPSRGYPDEPWHVIDLNPRGPVSAFIEAIPFEGEEEDMTPDQVAALARIDKFIEILGGEEFAKNLVKVELFAGVPGVDLSIGRLRQAIDSSIDLHKRFIFRDENGTPRWSLADVIAVQVVPMLRTLLASVGQTAGPGGAAVDPVAAAAALADAIREGLSDEIVTELAARLARGSSQ